MLTTDHRCRVLRKAIIKSKYYGRDASAEERQAARRDVVLSVLAEIKEFQNA